MTAFVKDSSIKDAVIKTIDNLQNIHSSYTQKKIGACIGCVFLAIGVFLISLSILLKNPSLIHSIQSYETLVFISFSLMTISMFFTCRKFQKREEEEYQRILTREMVEEIFLQIGGAEIKEKLSFIPKSYHLYY